MAAAMLGAVSACTSSPSRTGGGADLTTNNVSGTVTTTLNVPLETAQHAAVQAMQDLQYTVSDQSLDANRGVVKAKTADGTKVDVTLDRASSNASRLSVNAGITKSDIARNVARKIQDRTH
jgi:hypothetical protein